MKKIYAMLPCFNEEQNIGLLIAEWIKEEKALQEKGYELIIIAIDDCSTDNTRQAILLCCEKYSNVLLVSHSINKGLCGGINTAVKYFNDNGCDGDLMVIMDGDNTHSPIYVHKMLELIESGKDCVIASRYCESSSIVGLAKLREYISCFAKLYYSFVLRVPKVKDYTCGYRVYTFSIIERLVKQFGYEPVREKSFACMMELLYLIYLIGAKFGEVGFVLRYDNKQGESKMKILKTTYASITAALRLRYMKGRYNIGK